MVACAYQRGGSVDRDRPVAAKVVEVGAGCCRSGAAASTSSESLLRVADLERRPAGEVITEVS